MTEVADQGRPGGIDAAWEALGEVLERLEDDIDELAERRDLIGGISSRRMISNSVEALEKNIESALDLFDEVEGLLDEEDEEK